MNRYQNPEVYDRLAMSYVLGTLRGRARKRFEKLMQEHPFLKAVVEEKDLKFAQLAEYLPENKPADHVWERIDAAITTSQAPVATPARWWNTLLLPRYRGLAAMLLLVVLSFTFLFKPGHISEASAYMSTLFSQTSHKPVMAVQVMKQEMKMVIRPIDAILLPEGKKMVFWCIDKDQSKPYMNMGIIEAHGITEKKLEASSWRGIVDAARFAVSIEPVEAVNTPSPSGELVFVGELVALK